MNIRIQYLYHSGFICEIEDYLFIFDYWRGLQQQLDNVIKIETEKFSQYKKVIIFVSHDHIDHFDSIIYQWSNLMNIEYILSYDMEPSLIGHHLHPGDTYNIDNNIIVTAFNSTDLGVSYLLQYEDFTIMHCGDLNYWHWMDESTLYEISNAENEYKKIIKEIKKYLINVTMFPLDPRQGNMYDAGANYYIMEIKPDILIPMHFWNKTDMVFEYQKKNLDQKTKIVPLINSGDSINILFENKKIQQIEKYHLIRQISKNNTIENNIEKEIDPFVDSDLPLNIE